MKIFSLDSIFEDKHNFKHFYFSDHGLSRRSPQIKTLFKKAEMSVRSKTIIKKRSILGSQTAPAPATFWTTFRLSKEISTLSGTKFRKSKKTKSYEKYNYQYKSYYMIVTILICSIIRMEDKLEKSGKGDLHLTLEQILIRLREIFNSMMTEKEKFEEIERIYNGGNIPGILANQNIETNKLATKRTELQQKLIRKF